MASADRRLIPIKGRAHRIHGRIKTTVGALLSGAFTGTTIEVWKDGASANTGFSVTQFGTTGFFAIDITAAGMNFDACVGQITVTNANALPFDFEIVARRPGDGGFEAFVFFGAAAAGATASNLILPAAASAVDDFYRNHYALNLTTGEMRQILGYTGATKTAVVYDAGPPVTGRQWITAPALNDEFLILPEALIGAALSISGGEVAASLSTTQLAAIADKIIGRRVNGGADGGRTVGHALAPSRNKVTLVGTTLTVYDVDDTTALWTATVTLGARNPVTAVDPA